MSTVVETLHERSDSTENGTAEETRLLGFYDELRSSVAGRLSRRLPAAVADAVLLAPDLFVLLLRLTMDRQVPRASRSLFGGAIAYFVLPFDLFPEGILGVGGLAEDVVLAAAVLSHALGPELEPIAQKYWSGSARLRTVIRDTTIAAESLLGGRVYHRLRTVLARGGIDLATAPPAADLESAERDQDESDDDYRSRDQES